MQKSKRAWLHIFKHITSIAHLDVGWLTAWICAVRSSRVCWYVVWRWFYVHNIDYAKQFMFVYGWVCFFFSANWQWRLTDWFAANVWYIVLYFHCVTFAALFYFFSSFAMRIFISDHQHKNDEKENLGVNVWKMKY